MFSSGFDSSHDQGVKGSIWSPKLLAAPGEQGIRGDSGNILFTEL